VGLIRAHSPQAKGRAERLFRTPQDRRVKECRQGRAGFVRPGERIAGAAVAGAQPVVRPPGPAADRPHRLLGPGHRRHAVPCVQSARVVGDDVAPHETHLDQLRKPV
jgi:hypothetical protein